MIDFAIILILALCVLAGYYRGVLYSALTVGVTLVSLLFALLLVPVVSGVFHADTETYNTMLYYFEGYEYINETSVEMVLARAEDVTEAELNEIIANADIPIPMGAALKKTVLGTVYRDKGLVTLGDYFNQTIVNVVINILSFGILFIVLRTLLGFGLLMTDHAVHGLPILEKYDIPISCGIGFIHGVLIVFVIFMAVPIALTVLPKLYDTLNNSLLGNFFYRANVFLRMIPKT
ncbi:MAG: CvpA family protein [Clostridiales bacterium]|nr:CvpA family protein [Clostridiales bacterium]